MKKIHVAVAVLLSILVAVYGIHRRSQYKKTPEYSLSQLQQAMNNRNAAAFEKYFDVDRAVGGLVDQLFQKAGSEKRFKTDQIILAQSIHEDLLDFTKVQLAEAIRGRLMDYVETGAYEIEKEAIASSGSEATLSAIWQQTAGEDIDFKGFEYVEQEGETARAGLTFDIDDYDTTVVLHLIMSNRGDHWQVTELCNVPEIMRELVDLRNTRVLETMNQTLVLERFDKSTTNGRWGIGKKVIIELTIKNQGKKEIDHYAMKVTCRHHDGKELECFTVTDKTNIEPGETSAGFWYKDVDIFSTGDKALYELSQSNMAVTTSVESIVFADDSRLELWGSQKIM